MKRSLLFALVALCVPLLASAHEVKPAYLNLKQSSETTWQVHWKVPAKSGSRLDLYLRLPKEATTDGESIQYMESDAFVERWSFTIEDGLDEKEITIDGLSATMTDVLVRVEWLSGTTQTERLVPSRTTLIVESEPTTLGVVWTYTSLGVEHILFGFDHLLFVLALLLLVRKTKVLVLTITAFTVAHSITLAAAALGFVSMPPGPIEAVIALSIVFVAKEITQRDKDNMSLTEQMPWLVSFSFGLLHGFGFAGALAEIGLPQQSIPLALLFFNVGVEIGQLLFVLACCILLLLLKRLDLKQSKMPRLVTSYCIGSLAAYWTIERLLSLL